MPLQGSVSQLASPGEVNKCFSPKIVNPSSPLDNPIGIHSTPPYLDSNSPGSSNTYKSCLGEE